MNGKNWEKSKYYGKSANEIKEEWKKNGEEVSMLGTKMHFDIECYYNKCKFQNNSIEFKYFMNFVNDHSYLVPFRTEWMIWDEEFKLAGSIDMVYINSDNTISIYDWKRCKEINKTSKYDKYALTECINHLPDTNYWHYALQLNTYKYILEKNYDVKVKDLYLICLQPKNKKNTYQKIIVVD